MQFLFFWLMTMANIDDPTFISNTIKEKAAKYGLDPRLVAAIIYQESSGDIWASRYEDGFYHQYIKHLNRKSLPGYVPRFFPTLATEKRLRATSWGLMQIMGETAREHGFKARYLNKLARPKLNLEVGCRYFKHLLDITDDNTQKALLKWNGGGNRDYPQVVLAHISSGAYMNILKEGI